MEFLIPLACPLVLCVITAALAGRKGYNAWLWFLAAGILGLLVLAFLPFVNEKSELPMEQRAAKKRTGDLIGGAISAFALLLLLITFILR